MTKSEGKRDSNLISLNNNNWIYKNFMLKKKKNHAGFKVTFPHQLRARRFVINKHGDEIEIPSEEAHREQ